MAVFQRSQMYSGSENMNGNKCKCYQSIKSTSYVCYCLSQPAHYETTSDNDVNNLFE